MPVLQLLFGLLPPLLLFCLGGQVWTEDKKLFIRMLKITWQKENVAWSVLKKGGKREEKIFIYLDTIHNIRHTANVLEKKNNRVVFTIQWDLIWSLKCTCSLTQSPDLQFLAHLVLPGVSSAPPSTFVNSLAPVSEHPPGRWLHRRLLARLSPFF